MRPVMPIMLLLSMMVAASAPADNSPSSAEAERLLSDASVYGNAPNVSMRIAMNISSPQGKQQRTLEAFVRRDESGSEIYIHIIAPAFLTGMKYLTRRTGSGTDASWLSTSRGVRRLASGASGNERLFDSDFTVEDLSEMNVGAFNLKLLSDAEVGGTVCRSIEATPLVSGRAYARKVLFLDKSNSLLRGVDYFDDSGTLVRRFRVESTQTVDGTVFPLECRMAIEGEHRFTELQFGRIDLRSPIPDRLFNVGNLQ